MKCNKCKKEMINLWNLSWIAYTSDPIQWDEVYECNNCKIKETVRVSWLTMSDISKCTWENCLIKNKCRRYTTQSSEYQCYTEWLYEWNKCNLFYKN